MDSNSTPANVGSNDGLGLAPGRAAFEDWAAHRWGAEAYRHTSATCGEWDAWQAGATNASRTAWHNDRADALREVLKEIADLKSLTATPEQFARHLQLLACKALTADAMAEPEIEA